MKDISKLNALQILAIPPEQPERLFTAPEAIKTEFKTLAMRWHPDHCRDGQADEVMQRLIALHKVAEAKVKQGDWQIPGLLELTDVDGKTFRLHYHRAHPFELGTMYVGDMNVHFVLDDEHAILFLNAKKRIAGLTFDDAKSKKMKPLLPDVTKVFSTKDKCVMVLRKTADVLLLRDVLDRCGGKLDPKHVAWILNKAYQTVAYLALAADVAHNAINPDTFFISEMDTPKERWHTGLLLGGWWYAEKLGRKMNYVPTHTLDHVSEIRVHKKSDTATDLQMIRVMGRELLGDITGMTLRAPEVPQPMINFLRMPGGADPVADWRDWEEALATSFGKSRFHRLGLTATDIY